MNILKKIRAKQADLFAPPVAIAFLGDSVTQGCFEVYLTSEGAVQTVFEPESGYAADVRKLFALLYPGRSSLSTPASAATTRRRDCSGWNATFWHIIPI